MNTVKIVIILILLFFLQFIYFPIGMSHFEGSKVYVVELLVFVLLVLVVFSKEGFSLTHYKKSLLWCAAILFGITLYHLLFHQTQTLFFGNTFRQQGTLLLWTLFLFAILSSKISVEKNIKPLLIAVILFVQLICTVLFIGVGTDRPVGTIGEPNALAASVIFLWPFLLFAWPKILPLKFLVSIALLSAFLILFISGSRSGLIALCVQLSFIMAKWLLELFWNRQVQSRKVLTYASGAAIIVLLLSYITPFVGPRTEYEDRGEIWKAAAYAGISHPVVGVGFGNAEYEYHKANVALGNKLTGYYVDSAHNIFLDWFVQAGIVGVGVLFFLLYKTFSSFINRKQTRDIVLLLGLLTALSFNPASVVSLVGLWWLVGSL